MLRSFRKSETDSHPVGIFSSFFTPMMSMTVFPDAIVAVAPISFG
jgi:hypothetical protein